MDNENSDVLLKTTNNKAISLQQSKKINNTKRKINEICKALVVRTIKFNKGCLMDYFGFINSLLVPSACNIKQSISMQVSSAAFPFHILFLKYIILCH